MAVSLTRCKALFEQFINARNNENALELENFFLQLYFSCCKNENLSALDESSEISAFDNAWKSCDLFLSNLQPFKNFPNIMHSIANRVCEVSRTLVEYLERNAVVGSSDFMARIPEWCVRLPGNALKSTISTVGKNRQLIPELKVEQKIVKELETLSSIIDDKLESKDPVSVSKKAARSVIYLSRLCDEFSALISWNEDTLDALGNVLKGTLCCSLIGYDQSASIASLNEHESKKYQAFHRNMVNLLRNICRSCMASLTVPLLLEKILNFEDSLTSRSVLLIQIMVLEVCMEFSAADAGFSGIFLRHWHKVGFKDLLQSLDNHLGFIVGLCPNQVMSKILPWMPKVYSVTLAFVVKLYESADCSKQREALDEAIMQGWELPEYHLSPWLFIDVYHFLRHRMPRQRYKFQISVTLCRIKTLNFDPFVSLALEKLFYSCRDGPKDTARKLYLHRYSGLCAGKKSMLPLWNEASHWPWHHIFDSSMTSMLESMTEVVLRGLQGMAGKVGEDAKVELLVYSQFIWRTLVEGNKIGWSFDNIKSNVAEAFSKILDCFEIKPDDNFSPVLCNIIEIAIIIITSNANNCDGMGKIAALNRLVESLCRTILGNGFILDFELICQFMRVIVENSLEADLQDLEGHIYSRADEDSTSLFIFQCEFQHCEKLSSFLGQLITRDPIAEPTTPDVVQFFSLLKDLKRLHVKRCQEIDLKFSTVILPNVEPNDDMDDPSVLPVLLERKLDELKDTLINLQPKNSAILGLLEQRFQTIISSLLPSYQ